MIIDGHCDTLKECYKRKCSIADRTLNFNIMDASTPMIQMLAVYISPEEAQNGFYITSKVLDKFCEEKAIFQDRIVQIYSTKDIEKVKENSVGILLTIENGSAIQGNLVNIDKLYDRGIRMMSIVWNESNDLASGALEENDTGLTSLGSKFIQYLNQKNILIDVSHSSVKTFWDTVKISNRPIVASHSCVYNLCHHPRNLRDDQIKQIAKMKGIIGIAFCKSFLTEGNEANVNDVIKHIQYIKELVGIDYIGIGSDFDGLEEEDILSDIKGVKDIDYLRHALRNEGFNDSEINKVLGENWKRVLKQNL